jgi:lipoprotein-anchoring transpeptidase ErfK/SrfK
MMNKFRLDSKFTAKRKDLEDIVFIETEDHGTLFTDRLGIDIWEFDYDILKQGPNKSDEYKFENYPDNVIGSLDTRSRSLIDKINEFIDRYSPRFSRLNTFNGKTWDKIDLEKIPSVESRNRMFKEKEKLLEHYRNSIIFEGIYEISETDAADNLKPDDHANYRLLQKDSHGNVAPINDKEIDKTINMLDKFRLIDLGPASDSMLKGIAGLMQDICLGKYNPSKNDGVITLEQDADGVWSNGHDSHENIFSRYNPMPYIKGCLSRYMPSWKKIKKYAAIGTLSLGLILGSLQLGKDCNNYSIAHPAQKMEMLQNPEQRNVSDMQVIQVTPSNYSAFQPIVQINPISESAYTANNNTNNYDNPKDENNLSERMDNLRTKKIGPTSSMISPMKDVSLANNNLEFSIDSRGNANEAYAFFGGLSGSRGKGGGEVYRAKIENGRASFKIPLSYNPDDHEMPKLNVVAGYEVDGWLYWTSSWKFDVNLQNSSGIRNSPDNSIKPAPEMPAQESHAYPENAPAQNTQTNQNQYIPPVSIPAPSQQSAKPEYKPRPSGQSMVQENTESAPAMPSKSALSTLDSRIEEQYVILVNKHYQKASVFSVNEHGDYSFVTSYPVSTGINPGNKERQGDNRTPEGIFRITESVDTSDWTFQGERAYGSRGFRMDCGSWDSAGNHNENGRCSIMMHGTPSDEPYSQKYVSNIGTPASHGCIRFYDQDILELQSRYAGVGTQVIIYDSGELSSRVLEEVIEQDPRFSSSGHYRASSSSSSGSSSPMNSNNHYFNPSGEYARYSSNIIDNDMGQWLYNERVNTDKTRAELSREFSDRYRIGNADTGISKYAFYKIMDDYAAQNDIAKARKVQRLVNA